MHKKTNQAIAMLFFGMTAAILGTDVESAAPARATADIKGCEDAAISGSVDLIERPSAEGVKLVDVTIRVSGMQPGKHAVHIHETGKCTPCSEAKGHFDPGPYGFTAPDGNHPFHSGDLINLEVNPGGMGVLHTSTTRVTLSPGPLSVFDADGSAIIIHTDPDTYCPEGDVKGCAGGARAACGIIKMK
ncbi:MAG: superoxide dismutase family protein [Gammaproteobacteria bacterium]